MTSEQLQKANRLREEIGRLESFKEMFNNGYYNFIKATDHYGRVSISFEIHYGGELHKMINDYITVKLKQMQEEFENL